MYCNKRRSFALYVYDTFVYALFSYDVNVYTINLTLLLFFYSQPHVSFNSLYTRTNNSLDIVCWFYGVGSAPTSCAVIVGRFVVEIRVVVRRAFAGLKTNEFNLGREKRRKVNVIKNVRCFSIEYEQTTISQRWST